MSKIKKKHVAKLMPGEVCLVLDYQTAMHIAESYDFFAAQKEDEYSQSFRDVADNIRFQSQETYYDLDDSEYDEW